LRGGEWEMSSMWLEYLRRSLYGSDSERAVKEDGHREKKVL